MIGVFDSGYGGLSVLKELSAVFPSYSFMYLGDNARAPYGSRSKDIITEYTKEAVSWLFEHGAEVVVLACNTASGEALPTLSETFLPKYFPDKVALGVIEPVALRAEEFLKKNEPVAVIGTPSTIRSKRYDIELAKRGFTQVVGRATPLLAPLVETGDVSGPTAEHILADALAPITREGIGAVILGCTHYYFLKDTIEKMYPHLKLLDASDAFPLYFKQFLSAHPEIEERIDTRGERRFYTTDEENEFTRFVERTLGFSVRPEKIRLVP